MRVRVLVLVGVVVSTSLLSFIAVGVGAALGAWLRWGLSVWLNDQLANFPLGTFVANVIGGLLIGIAIAYFSEHTTLSPVWRLAIMTGFLGGLTTFSTYSAEVVGLLARGQIGWGIGVAVAHLAVSFAFTALGLWAYRAV